MKIARLTDRRKVEIVLGVFDNSVNLRRRQAEGEKEGLKGREEKFVVHPLELANRQKIFVYVVPDIVERKEGGGRTHDMSE